MVNYTFYAIIDGKNGGICSLKNNDYSSLKAIFKEKEEAEKAIQKNGSPDLSIIKVGIVEG